MSYDEPHGNPAGAAGSYWRHEPGAMPTPPTYPPANASGSGKATGALICGILSLVLCFVPIVGGVLAIIAIILAALAKHSGDGSGKSTAGLITGIIGVLLGVLFTVITAWAVILLASDTVQSDYVFDDIMEELDTEWDDGWNGGPSEEVLSGTFENPDDQAAYDAAVEVLDIVCNPDDTAKENLAHAIDASFEDTTGMKLADMGVEPIELVEWITSDASYTITDVYTTEEGYGAVHYTSNVRDLDALVDLVGDKIDEYKDTPEFQRATPEEKAQKLGDIMHEAIDESVDMQENRGALDMQEFGGKWAPGRDSLDNLANEFYGTYWG